MPSASILALALIPACRCTPQGAYSAHSLACLYTPLGATGHHLGGCYSNRRVCTMCAPWVLSPLWSARCLQFLDNGCHRGFPLKVLPKVMEGPTGMSLEKALSISDAKSELILVSPAETHYSPQPVRQKSSETRRASKT